MPASDDHFDEFDDHTKLKHAILRSYVSQWAMITMHRGSTVPQACFYDAFAGAGADGVGNEGSPLIAARASDAVLSVAAQGLIRPDGRLRVALSESKRRYFRSLMEHLAPFTQARPDDFLLRHARCDDVVTEVRDFAGTRPLVSFLDPFGVDGLNASYYPLLLRGPKDEIFVLVNGPAAARIQGVRAASTTALQRRVAALRAQPTLFEDLYEASLAPAEEALRARERYLAQQQPPAEAILLRALGSQARLERVAQAPSAEWGAAFVAELSDALAEAGAPFVVRIPMSDESGVLKYTLIHASQSERAVIAMKEAVSTALGKDALSADMRQRIRADLALQVRPFVDALCGMLHGQEVPWAQKHAGNLQDMLLEETRLFTFQMPELKAALQDRGILIKRDRKLFAVFPAIP